MLPSASENVTHAIAANPGPHAMSTIDTSRAAMLTSQTVSISTATTAAFTSRIAPVLNYGRLASCPSG